MISYTGGWGPPVTLMTTKNPKWVNLDVCLFVEDTFTLQDATLVRSMNVYLLTGVFFIPS